MPANFEWDSVTDIGDAFARSVWQASSKFLELGGLAPGKIVVDLACGVGDLGRQIAPRVQGQGGRVIGVDRSPRMIEAARHAAAGVDSLELVVEDAADLSLADGSCDVVFCRFALPVFAEPTRVLARSLTVLKPGGRFAVMGIGGGSHNELFSLLGDVLGEPVQRAIAYGETGKLAGMLEDAGFEAVKTRSIRALITVEDPRAYWSCVRGMFGIADSEIPPEIASRVPPGKRLSLELVFALATKHDPGARAAQHVRSLADMVAAARRSIRELSPYEVKRKLKGEQVIMIDVREPEAREERIKNAVNVPRGELERLIGNVVNDPRALILTYCGNGQHGALAARQLQEVGYENVWNLYGGITAWLADGMPVERR
jgi:ubiquinone/menaquinone biosynthesis C-methylase UbiE/rhodanese-related sulfurtransferase